MKITTKFPCVKKPPDQVYSSYPCSRVQFPKQDLANLMSWSSSSLGLVIIDKGAMQTASVIHRRAHFMLSVQVLQGKHQFKMSVNSSSQLPEFIPIADIPMDNIQLLISSWVKENWTCLLTPFSNSLQLTRTALRAAKEITNRISLFIIRSMKIKRDNLIRK